MVGLQRRNVENKCAKVVDEMHVILKIKNIKEKEESTEQRFGKTWGLLQ